VGIDHHVVIVGAGFSGIGAAISLERAGFDDYLIVEEGRGFGGTWYWNRYPGIAVDIPSFSYQFSFEQLNTWSRTYAPGEELRAYAEHCARKHGLGDKTRFGVRVTAAAYDEATDVWELATSEGDTIRARNVIDATGVLTVPKRPEIEGLDDFKGVTVHTARWDPDVELAGKRVAVIGTGASAIQLIPLAAEEAAHLTVFQRTPIWCMPKYDYALPSTVQRAMAWVPGVKLGLRLLSQTLVEIGSPLTAHYHRPLGLASRFEGRLRAYIRSQVHDPELADKLTPRYALGCKRPSFHNTYLKTYNRPNVTLETDPIARVTPTGVETASGTAHDVDVLVLATGFKVFDPGNFPKYPTTGRGGTDLDGWWREHRYQAYEGVSVPGFPNYFLMFGPYAYNGASYFNLVETQARHIVRVLRHARARRATAVEVSRAANDRYFAEMLSRRERQVFWQASCGLANSYYFDEHGDVPLRASLSVEAMWRSARFPLADYELSRVDAAVPATA
jgi:cation diffusion facilitator CzcD-associated flavoprotein CzcO